MSFIFNRKSKKVINKTNNTLNIDKKIVLQTQVFTSESFANIGHTTANAGMSNI